ncbi:probable protein S-acyltransferase 7 [Jatropha curcas]|uniref:probable protein S-acyltransferase 7 n=1 Tax=Jatropha curcas TaxID=180498 RepID=UPI0018930469|nr:probable protein S-acyltransferase 7 [Jatropha curcas]
MGPYSILMCRKPPFGFQNSVNPFQSRSVNQKKKLEPKTMESVKSREDDIEMEAIALSSPSMEELANDVLNNDRKENISHGKNAKLGNILITIREKFNVIVNFVADQWLKQYCLAAKSDQTRVYQVWPGNNVFFFHGRLVCGPDPKGLLLTIVSIIVSSWIFAMYTEDDLPVHSSLLVIISLVLTLTVLLNLFLVSTTDPGIIPRNHRTLSEEIGSSNGGTRRKRVTINGIELKLKYCHICKIYRPPRSSHCVICNNCVEKFDHHCPWVGQCIALRNYIFYMTFVISALNFFVYIFVFTVWRIQQRMSRNGNGLIGMMMNYPETMALVLFSFAAIWFLCGLVIFHVYLIAINQTAYENFRKCYMGSGNPFNKGILCNIKQALFSPLQPSRVDFGAQVTTIELVKIFEDQMEGDQV